MSRGLGFKGANANSQAGKHKGGRRAATCYARAQQQQQQHSSVFHLVEPRRTAARR